MTDNTPPSLEQVAYDVLNEMYDEAEPSLDFEYARKNPEEMADDWYQDHYLHPEKQRKIVEKHADKHNLSESERTSLHWTCILDLGPTSDKESVEA